MRVRHLQSHLAEQGLVHQGRLERLRGVRVGVDAVFWLRSIQALKDPFADALGGIPPGIFGFVDKELEAFRKHEIQPLFVFQGVAPGPQHSMFVSRMDQQMELAWTYLAKGQKAEAQKCFAVSTSRINGDFVYFIFHHLRSKGYECIQAPYFAGAQLAHFAEQGVVSAVFGPPGLLLYGVKSVVIHITFAQLTFDWVDLSSVLEKWAISRDQFVDACMLAGTEYCLTYPYLNLGHFQPATSGRFNFDAAVFIIKQAPLINWMQTFPTEDMKSDHVDGYCICKVLVQNSPVLHLQDHSIRPLGAGEKGSPSPQVPNDFSVIMGEKLPNSLYYLMLTGIISHKLPQALAKGEWTDKSQPLVDTMEFRDLLGNLQEYRQVGLGLIARHLHEGFQKKKVLCKAFWDTHQIRQGLSGADANLPSGARTISPNMKKGLKWNITKEMLQAEMERQGNERIDFKFCLTWHAYEFEDETASGLLLKNITGRGYPSCTNDVKCLAALVHFMVLENLDFIESEGCATLFGSVLKDSPPHLQEPCLVALELLKWGGLNGEPFEPAQIERPFPQQVEYPDPKRVDTRTKAVHLLSRVMSLVPMKLKNDMWNADVDFDLAAFHSLVRILKRALRQLVEASLTSVLLKDLSRVKLLPPGFMCASPKKEDHMQTPAILPTFMLPRACMGIVVRHFLDYRGEARAFYNDLSQKFPCCSQPIEDLKTAFAFWHDLRRCVDHIAEPLDAQELAEDMRLATELLEQQQKRMNWSSVSGSG
mmetsp:Transcript_90628/g.259153  ORF Transcript_90628/g.259153 Transcript_90628/m.259153 type:complete len:760 (-) Transcript_90628:224-2503(-)